MGQIVCCVNVIFDFKINENDIHFFRRTTLSEEIQEYVKKLRLYEEMR